MTEKHINVNKRGWLNSKGLTSVQVSFSYDEYEWTSSPDEYGFINITNGYSSVDLDYKEFVKLAALVEKARAAFVEKTDAEK